MKKILKESDLHDYQEVGRSHLVDNPKAGLLMEMGLGKTATVLSAILDLLEFLFIANALVVAPKRVVESVWKQEAEKWEHLQGLTVRRIIGTPKQRIAALKEKADIHVISRDNIVWLIGQFGGSMLPFDMVVYDESSSFKNSKSVRFKALRKVCESFSRSVILTGTPTPNTLFELWPQIFLLDQGERLGKKVNFRDTFFEPDERNSERIFSYSVKPSCEQIICDKIADICISMKADDYLTLPERIDNYIYIDFPVKLAKSYKDFEEEQILELIDSDAEITAANAAALMGKLLQFANGAVYDTEKEWHVVHDLKLDALEEILEAANGEPVLLAWSFRHDLYRIEKRFKKYGVRAMKTQKDIDDWNAGKIPLMIMHPASGSHGLNLQQGGHILVWFGLTWSLEYYLQFCARLYRQGQEYPTFIHHIVCRGTVDEKVVERIAAKDGKQETVMQAVKAKIEDYKKQYYDLI